MHSQDLFKTDNNKKSNGALLAEGLGNNRAFKNTEQGLSEPFIKARSIWVTVSNNEQLHLRHFYRNADFVADTDLNTPLPGDGRSVFMLHGEAECGRIFYGSIQRGLAWHLAKQGYEVFVADLGSRGRSLVAEGEVSQLSVNDLVTDAIPKLLQACAKQSTLLRFNQQDKGPDIWIGHSFGAVLLAAAWSRMDASFRTATQMVFLGARRRMTAATRRARFFAHVLSHVLVQKSLQWVGYFPARQLNIGTADENLEWYKAYTQWLNAEQWLDPSDRFDYREALQCTPLPPVLHMAPRHSTFFSSPADVRAFVEELGQHDARLVFIDKHAKNAQPYNHISMLLGGNAEQDIFADTSTWLASTDEFDRVMQTDELTDDTQFMLPIRASRNDNLVDNHTVIKDQDLVSYG